MKFKSWPAPGDTFGSYRIENCLGAGGMGSVFSAWDELLERPVALKLLHGEYAGVLLDEARALAAVTHPNIVRIHELHHADPVSYFVMERIEGEDLGKVMERGLLPPLRAIEIVRDVAAALGVIHAGGWVHGDVKPSNVVIERGTGRVVLTDFGLSRRIQRTDDPLAPVTGTPEYLAPERCAAAEVPAEMRAREDVYSLAVMAFELLTGRIPFEGSVQQIMFKQVHCDVPPPSTIRPALGWRIDRVMESALAKDPLARTSTPALFADALARALTRSREPARILVVDDDGDFRQLIAVGLARRIDHIVVEGVSDGQAAFDAASRRLPDVVLLDLELPGESGIEIAGALRTVNGAARLPVFVVSGRAKPGDIEVLRRVGVTRCFGKPVELDPLARAVRDALAGERGVASATPARSRQRIIGSAEPH